uniref:SMC hinge domain-containing protein n=1 Tax=Rhodnius prolixus TaxID=13249 RepID=T1HEQ8_RHOPR
MNLAQKLIRLLMLMWQRWSTISTGYKQEKILKRPEKDIIINNFKSYGEETTIDNFSPISNILVGSNGSGKSNFLEAIKFVIDFGKSYKQQSEKIKLYHHGRKCFLSVEIIFAAYDQLVGKRDIILKRTQNGERSKFYLNGEGVHQEEFQKFLELCGFSIRNPYYFVTLKSASNFIGFSPNERLNFIISNLGTNISTTLSAMKKIVNSLENAKYRFDMAKDIVSYMDTSKSTLLQEVNKLDKYKELSQKKNSLLMLLHQKLILKWKANISELQNLLENTNSHASTSHQFNSAIAALKISLNEVKVIMVNYLLIKEDILKELNILLAKKEKISLSIDEVNKNIEFVKNKIKEQTLDDLNTEIHLKIEHLYELEERYRNEKCKLQELEEQLYSANQTRLDLISNETRTFTSEKERNLWIENQISTIQVQIHENDTKSTKLLEEKNELIEKRFNLETFFMELDDSHDSETLANKEAETKCQYAYLMNALNDVRHALCEIENSIKMVKNNLDIMKGKLRVKIGRATHDGCESVDKVIAKWQGSDDENYHNLFKGYHGLVIDNFVCDDKLNVAVEAAIGNRLFQHIVDSSRTGNAILKEMNSMQLPGEVWFLPLDKINKPILQYPQDENVRPLIDVIKFSENIEKAMKFIFGKILICKDLEIAVHVARLYRFTCVTLDGDKIFGTRSPKDEIQLIKMNKLIEEFEKKINVLNNKLLELDFEKKKLNDDIIYKKNIRSLKNAEHNDLNTYERKRNDLLTKEKLIVARMQTLNEKLKWTDQKIIKAEEEVSVLLAMNDKKIKDLEKLKQLKLDMQTDKQFMQKEKLREKIRYFYLKIKESENYIVSLYEKKYSKLILSRFEDKSLLMDLIAFGNNYGLGLTVRFSGDREELGVNTLSKGEQTIILISIIFALLKTQKFPLCLFDEIDGHLSKEQHLQFIRIVGGMSNVQFLISSHHENMIRYGHKIWQISYESLKSRMKSIEFNKAQEVLQKIQYSL